MTDAPTAATMKAAYPEFAAVSDAAVNTALSRASLKVSSPHWPDPEFLISYQLYTAHLLVLQGLGTGAEARGYRDAPLGTKRRKAGDHEIEFQGGRSAGSSGENLGLTSYGVEFASIRRQLFAGPRIVRGYGHPDSEDAPYPEGAGIP